MDDLKTDIQKLIEQAKHTLPYHDYMVTVKGLKRFAKSLERIQRSKKPFLTFKEIARRRRILYSTANSRDGLAYCPICKRNYTEYKTGANVYNDYHSTIRNTQCPHLPCIRCFENAN